MSDLGPLAGLVRLTTLRLDWRKQVSDLSPLVGLTQLAGVFGNLGAQPGVRCLQRLDLGLDLPLEAAAPLG